MSDIPYAQIREVIAFARQFDIDINKLTVSPSIYKILERGAALSPSHVGGALELRYGKILIDKRPCTGCCQHD